MNQLFTFNEAAGFLRKPPSLAPRPNFPKICTLRKYLTQLLKQLDCPQSLIYGWAGLVMDPRMYALIKTSIFMVPPDQGNIPTYPQFITIQNINTADCVWENAKCYYFSYINISRACFRMLDELISNHFKVLNDPALLGWNPTMSIQTIMAQLELSYGKPTTTILWNKNKLFLADFLPNNAHELLFHHVKQCQEVTIIADMPYTVGHLISNTMLLDFPICMYVRKPHR